MRIPATILSWNDPASLPRRFAGAISDIYIGPTTDEAPTAIPPVNLNNTNKDQTENEAQPIADRRYIMAITIKTLLRPYFFAGKPAIIEPITVPIMLDVTVKPCQKGLSDHKC